MIILIAIIAGLILWNVFLTSLLFKSSFATAMLIDIVKENNLTYNNESLNK